MLINLIKGLYPLNLSSDKIDFFSIYQRVSCTNLIEFIVSETIKVSIKSCGIFCL